MAELTPQNVPITINKTPEQLWEERVKAQGRRELEERYREENYFKYSGVDMVSDNAEVNLPKCRWDTLSVYKDANFKSAADNSAYAESLPEDFQGLELSEQEKATEGFVWFNPYDQKMVYGMMTANEAMFMYSGFDHATGLANRNARNLYLRSSLIMNEDLRNQLGGAFVSEYNRDKEEIKGFRAALYNINNWVEMIPGAGDDGVKSPLLSNVFGNGVEGTFYSRESLVQGENKSEEMLATFQENAPEVYNNLLRMGIDVDRITKDARNTHEFMGIIMGAQAENAIQLSLAYSEQTGGHTMDSIWSFFRDSILEDPDAAAELGVGLALSWTGVVPIAIATLKGAKISNKVYEFKKFMEKAGRLQKVLRGLRQGHQMLPSQIPNTLMKHVLPDVAKLKWYSPKKLGTLSAGNMAEGIMEGTGVAVWDNYHRVEYQGGEWDALNIMDEGLLEGAISIGLNPAMGGVFRGSGAITGYTAGWVGNQWGPLAAGSDIREAIGLSLQLNKAETSDQFDEMVRQFHMQGELGSFLSTELGRPVTRADLKNGTPVGEAARFLLNSMDHEPGATSDPLLDILNAYQEVRNESLSSFEAENERRAEAGEDILPTPSQQPEDIMASLMRVGYARQVNRGTAVMDPAQFERFVQGKWLNARISRLAEGMGMEVDEYRSWLTEPGQEHRLIAMVPDDFQDAVKKRLGDQEHSWEAVNTELNALISERFAVQIDSETAEREADENQETAIMSAVTALRERILFEDNIPTMTVTLPSGRAIVVSNPNYEPALVDTTDSLKVRLLAKREEAAAKEDHELVRIYDEYLGRIDSEAQESQTRIDEVGMQKLVERQRRVKAIIRKRERRGKGLAELNARLATMMEEHGEYSGARDAEDQQIEYPPHIRKIQMEIARIEPLYQELNELGFMLEDASAVDMKGGLSGTDLLAKIIEEEKNNQAEEERYQETLRHSRTTSDRAPESPYKEFTREQLVQELIDRGLASEDQKSSLLGQSRMALLESLERSDVGLPGQAAPTEASEAAPTAEPEVVGETPAETPEAVEAAPETPSQETPAMVVLAEIQSELTAEAENVRSNTKELTVAEAAEQMKEAAGDDAELTALVQEVEAETAKAEKINEARTERLRARSEIEAKMETVQEQMKDVEDKLTKNNANWLTIKRNVDEQKAIRGEESVLRARVLKAQEDAKTKDRPKRAEALVEKKKNERELRELQRRNRELVKKEKVARKALKKDSNHKKLRNLTSQMVDLRNEWENWGMADILASVEHYSHGLKYRAYGLISQNLKMINAKWNMIQTNVNTHFETDTEISKKELARELYGEQENHIAQLEALDKSIKDKDTLTKSEAQSLLRKWRSKQEQKALSLKGARDTLELTGDEFKELDQVQSNNSPGEHIDDIDPDNEFPSYAQSTEDANKGSTGFDEKVHITTRANEAVLLKQAFNLLAYLKNTRFGSSAMVEGQTTPDGQPSKVGTAGERQILACLPKALQDIGPHILFEEAITNKAELGEIVGNHNRHLARYDVDHVTDIVWAMLAEATAGDKKRAEQSIEAARKSLSDPNDPYSDFNIYGSIAEIEADMIATREINKKLNKQFGYTLTLDRQTGELHGRKTTREKYEAEALNTAVQWMMDHTHSNRVALLVEEFGVDEEAIRATYGSDKEAQLAATREVLEEVVLSFVETHDLELGDWGGPAKGREQIDWQPANELGKGIATLLSGKTEGTSYARTIDPTSQEIIEMDGRATERSILNDSLKPTELVPGELNFFAPNKGSVLRKLKEDFKIRKRIEHIVNHDLTDSEVREFLEWARDAQKEGLLPEEFLGDVPIGISLVSQISNRGIMNSPADIDRVRQILLEAVIDMPHALYSFIHDSQTIANGQKLFFKTPMELFEQFKGDFINPETGEPKDSVGQLTESEKNIIIDNNPTVALYHTDPSRSGGTPTGAVSLAGLGYVMGWERTYPGLDGLSEIAIEEGIKYIQQSIEEGVPLEDLYSPATYADKSFNGKHHFHAMLIDMENDQNQEDFNKIADLVRSESPLLKERKDYNLEMFETDEYIATAKIVKEQMEKVIKNGAAEENTLTEEEIKLISEVNDMFYFAEEEVNPFDTLSDSEIKDKFALQREFWKMPIMVRLYSAGAPAIRSELTKFASDYDMHGELTNAHIKAFTKLLVAQGVIQRNVILDVALRMEGDAKKRAVKMLKRPLSKSARERLDDFKSNSRLSIDQDLDPTENLRDRLDRRIEFIAAMTGKSVAQVRNHFQERLDTAEKYLEDKGVSEAGHLTERQFEEYQRILCFDDDAWRNMPFLKSLNMMGGTGHRISKTSRVEQETAGWMGVTDADLMLREDGTGGVMDQLWYHTFAPDLAGNRTHSTWHDGLQTQGTEFGRVTSQENKAGMWELEHNSLHKIYQEAINSGKTPEQAADIVRKEMDKLLVKDLSIKLAGAKAPSFGEFKDATDAEFMETWASRSEGSNEEYQKALTKERKLKGVIARYGIGHPSGMNAQRALERMRKNHGLPSERVFLQDEKGTLRESKLIDTSNPSGLAAFRYKHANVSFFDRGNLMLRKIYWERKQQEVEKNVNRRQEMIDSGRYSYHKESLFPREARGFAHMHEMEALPFIPDGNFDFRTELLMDEHLGHSRMKARLKNSIERFARRYGLEDWLAQGRIADIVILMNTNSIKGRHAWRVMNGGGRFRDLPDSISGVSQEARERLYRERDRRAYLDDFWELFRTQHDAENFESRSGEMFPSGGIPATKPGLFNPGIYRKTKKDLIKSGEKDPDIIEKKSREEASKPEHNTYVKIWGRYNEPTNNLKALTMSFVPNEHIVIEEGETGKGLDFEELAELPLSVQGNDIFDIMNYMQANEQVRESVDELVAEGKQYKEEWEEVNGKPLELKMITDEHKRSAIILYLQNSKDVHGNETDIPLRERLWEVSDGNAMREVHARAKEKGAFDHVANFNLYVWSNGSGTYKSLVTKEELLDPPKEQPGGGAERRAGPVGGKATKVVGSLWRYRLTPEGAFLMLNGINNIRAMQRLELATATGVTIGEETALSDRLENRPFFDKRNEEAILANVVDELTREYSGDPEASVRTVTHGYQGYRGQRLQVIDTMSYLFPRRSRGKKQAKWSEDGGNYELHVEADLLPLRQVLRNLRRLGQNNVADEINSLIDGDINTAVALGTLLRFEAESHKTVKQDLTQGKLPADLSTSDVKPETLEIFLNLEDPETTYKKAVTLLERINTVLDRGNKNNDWYFRVRNNIESKVRVEMRAERSDEARGLIRMRSTSFDTLADELGATSHEDQVAVQKAVLQMTQHDTEFATEEHGEYAWMSEVDPIEYSTNVGFRKHFAGNVDAMRVASQIERMTEVDPDTGHQILTEEQADILRVILSQAVIKNPDILSNLYIATNPGDISPGTEGQAHFKDGKYLITFDGKIKNTPDLINVIAHELAHIGVMKFVRKNGLEWAQAEAILQTPKGREMMWEFVKTFNGGQMTSDAINRFNRYVDNPEEFMVQFTSYVMQKDSLYETGALAKIEAKYRPVVGALKNVIRKIGGFYSKILHDIRQVFDRYRETEPELYDRMERLAFRIQGLGLDMSAVHAIDPTESLTRELRISRNTFTHENATTILDGQRDLPPGAKLNDTNESYLSSVREKDSLILVREKLKADIATLKAKQSVEPTLQQANELTRSELALDTINQSIAELNATIHRGAYGVDALGLTREEFERGLDDLRKRAGEFDEETGEWSYDARRFDSVKDERIYLSLVLRNGSLELGDKISENFAALVRNGMGTGVGKSIIDAAQKSLTTGAKTEHTFLSPHGFLVVLSSMIEDGVITSTNVYHSKLGVKSLSSVRKQMDRIRSQIRKRQEMIWMEHGERGAIVVKAAGLLSRGLDIPESFELTSAELDSAKDYHDRYSRSMNVLYQRAKDTGLVSKDEGRTPTEPVVWKLKKTVNVTPTEQKTFRDKMSPMIADRLRLRDTSSRVDHITLWMSPFMPNHLRFLPGARNLFSRDWQRMRETDVEIGNYMEDQAMVEYMRDQDESLEALDSSLLLEDTTHEELRKKWNGETDAAPLSEEIKDLYRRRVSSKILHRSRRADSSIDNIFEGASQVVKRNILIRYNDTIENGIEDPKVKEKIDWTRLHRSTFDSYLGYKPFGEEFVSSSLSDAKMPIESPQDWHAATFYSKATSSAFAPYDSDFYPTAEQIEGDADLNALFEADLAKVLTGFITGLGTDASQRIALQSITKSNVSFPNLLGMLSRVAEQHTLFDHEGKEIQGGPDSDLQTSLNVQLRKYNVLTGIGVNYVKSGDRIIDAIGEHGQDMIRLVYGSNLATAITMTEGSLTTLSQLISLQDFGTVATGPLRWFRGLNKQKRMEMADELAYLISHTTRDMAGDDPYLNEVLTEEEKKTGLYDRLQRGHLEVSKYADLQARIAASITGRKFLLKKLNNGSLDALIEKIENTAPEDMPMDQRGWKAFLREIPKLGAGNHRIILMMKKAGLLNPESIRIFRSLLTETDGYNGTYSLSDISNHIFGGGTTDAGVDLEAMLDVLNSLDKFDKEFTSQFLIDHRVMDSTTDPTAAHKMIMMYRNFPTSFAIQRVIRDSSNMSLPGYFAKHVWHMLVDSMYMMLLQVAAGREPEEILDDWKEDPVFTLLKYMSRWPGLTPWWGLIVQGGIGALQMAVTGKSIRDPSIAPIQISAWMSLVNKLFGSDLSTSEKIAETAIALERVIPVAGEAANRAVQQLVVNALAGDVMGGGSTGPGRPRSRQAPVTFRTAEGEARESSLFSTPESRALNKKMKDKSASDAYWDGSDMGYLIEMLRELSKNNIMDQTLWTKPQLPNEAMDGFLGRWGVETPESQAPQTQPQPPQVQETPQVSPTSESAPEPPEERTKDPVASVEGDSIKEAPPEIFN